jgi:hypothetical protein
MPSVKEIKAMSYQDIFKYALMMAIKLAGLFLLIKGIGLKIG